MILFVTLSPFLPLPAPALSHTVTGRKESEALDVKAAEAGRAMVEARAELARAKNM